MFFIFTVISDFSSKFTTPNARYNNVVKCVILTINQTITLINVCMAQHNSSSMSYVYKIYFLTFDT